MKIHVKNRFWVIPNHILCDARLSWKAKWLWVYIQSKPDDWDFSSDRMSREAPDGRDSTRSGLRELERFWFLTRTRWHGAGGHWDYEWELNEVWNTLNTPTPIKRDTENTATDEPTTDNPSTENTAIIQERDTKKELQIHTSIIDSESTLKIEVTKTPREIAQEFFNMDEEDLFKSLYVDTESVSIKEELRNFREYWTTLTMNGKKQKWEKQETFDIKLRLKTWFRNAKSFKKPTMEDIWRVADGFKLFE